MFHKLWSKEVSEPTYVYGKILKSNAKKALETWIKMDTIKVSKLMFLTKGQVQDAFQSEEEMEVVIDYLKSIQSCDICVVDEVIYVKFCPNRTNVKVKEHDINLLRLHRLNKATLQEIKVLEHSISDTRLSIKRLLKTDSRSQAKLHLKRMKRMQTTLEKKLAVLNNVELITEGIETASDQIDVVNAYKAGLSALKNELGRSEKEEDVTELMQDMNYYMKKVTEISDVISGECILDSDDTITDAELNKELDSILSDESHSKEEELIKTLDSLTIANHDPSDAKLLKNKEKNNSNASTLEYSP